MYNDVYQPVGGSNAASGVQAPVRSERRRRIHAYSNGINLSAFEDQDGSDI